MTGKTDNLIRTTGGLTLTEEEFLGALASFSNLPLRHMKKLWDDGVLIGSLTLGFAQREQAGDKGMEAKPGSLPD